MIHNRKFILPLVVLLAAVALGTMAMMVRANADQLLQESARRVADATAVHAILDFQVTTPDNNGSGTVEIWGQKEAGPDGEPAFRVELQQASGDKAESVGSVAVSNGRDIWIYRPDKNTVYVGTVAELKERMREGHSDELTGYDLPQVSDEDRPQTPEEAVDKLLEYFTASRAGSVDISGIKANQLRLVPIPEQMPDEIRANGGLFDVWVRAGDSAPLGIEFSGAAVGSGKITASLLELQNPADDSTAIAFDEGTFSFTIPAGAEVKQLADLQPPEMSLTEAVDQAGFDLLIPASVPATARLERINEVRGAIVQRYRLRDGGSFTIAQGEAGAAGIPDGTDGQAITVRGLPGTLYENEDGTRTLLTWQENSLNVWIGGDISADEAIGLADSLQ